MPIIEFDPVDHGAWVYSTFAASARQPRAILNEILRHGGKCMVEVGHEDPTLCIGFAVVAEGEVVWVYVKPKARDMGKARRLLAALGVDMSGPLVAWFSSPACDGMRRRGKPIRYIGEVENG